MTKPETDSERSSRHSRELEGKNIAHHSVLLRTVIESKLEGIKQIIAISSAGIGLQYALERFAFDSCLLRTRVVLSMFSVLGFFVAVFCGIWFFWAAGNRYEKELRGAERFPEYEQLLAARKSLFRWRLRAIYAFLAGVLGLAVSVVLKGVATLT